jgi:hypothetical protein
MRLLEVAVPVHLDKVYLFCVNLGDKTEAVALIGAEFDTAHSFLGIFTPLKFRKGFPSLGRKDKKVRLRSRVVEFFTADDVVVARGPLESLNVKLHQKHEFHLVFNIVHKKAVSGRNGGKMSMLRGEAKNVHFGVGGARGILLETVGGLGVSGRIGDHVVEGCGLVGEHQEPLRGESRRVVSERTRRLL